MSDTVKVLFASGSEDLIPTAIEHMRQLFPEIPLVVVSEFAPEGETWIPFRVARGFWENLAFFRWHFRGRKIRISAVILQPRMPYWKMRWIAFFLSPRNFLAFNENLGHFMLRPVAAGTILRHVLWRTRNFLVWHFSPGGAVYTFFWRLVHPKAFRRPLLALLARSAVVPTELLKSLLPARRLAAGLPEPRQAGISVVIPSRNGKDLLRAMLPEVVRQVAQIGGEIVVVDNGSDDGTAVFLQSEYPGVVLELSADALSFARAVNIGIRKSRYAHICLLNNDMLVELGFFAALRAAFDAVPDLILRHRTDLFS